MKDIGERFKETREGMEISIEEASEDLKTKVDILENLEEGNMDYFKDIITLKSLIRDYSKYLGLDKDEMIDNFNEYLFDYTSRISLEEIVNAKKNEQVEEEKKIQSPYTIEHKNRTFLSNVFIVSIVLVLLLFIGYFVYRLAFKGNSAPSAIIVNFWGEKWVLQIN